MVKITHASGKRKKAIARATLKAGTGAVRINSIPLQLVQPELARLKLAEPLTLAPEYATDFDIDVNVRGGGPMAQAEAARLAIATALVNHTRSDRLKTRYLGYDRTLLVADVRQRETRKPNTRGNARAKRQKSYR